MSSGGGEKSGGGDGKGRRATGRVRESKEQPPKEPKDLGQGAAAAAGEETTTTERGGSTRGRRGRNGEGEGSGSGKTSPTEGSPPSAGDRGSPIDEATKQMKAMQIVELAGRPGYGTQGRKLALLANHHRLIVPSDMMLCHYHVDISLGNMKINRDENRIIFWRCIGQFPAVFGSPYKIIYDGDHICITHGLLNFPKEKADETGGFVYQVNIRLGRMDPKPEMFKVRFMQVGLVSLNVKDIQSAGTPSAYTTPLNILDLLFRQNRSCPEVESSKAWYPFANTVYRVAGPKEAQALGFGQVIWQGLFGSARVGTDYTPFINFDVSHSGFYRVSSGIDLMLEVLNGALGGGFRLDQLNQTTTLNTIMYHHVNREFKGLTVVTEVVPRQGEPYKKEHRVTKVSSTNAITQTFDMRMEDGTQRTLSVAEYYQQRYGPLRFPSLQLLAVGAGKRQAFLPIERVVIKDCQKSKKKLLPIQTADMIKAAAIAAPARKQKIDQLVAASAFHQDPWLQAFGVQVNPKMEQVEARVLTSPRMVYAGGRSVNVDPGKGSWDQRQQKFFIGAGTQRVGAIVIDDRDANVYNQFFHLLMTTCNEFGMQMPSTIGGQAIRQVSPANAVTGVEERLKEFTDMGAGLVIVTLPSKNSQFYPTVKRVAEINCGVVTQCVVKQTITKCVSKNDKMTTGNLALKMNMKLGGINWKGEADMLAKKFLEEQPTLVLGIDVTHPGPLEKRAPSIASVVGNLDASFMRYGASILVQKHRREAVVYLQEPVRERLHEYFLRGAGHNDERKKTNLPPLPHGKPQRIIVYRDGVAESQFQEILKAELGSIREACHVLDTTYKPSITFIVGQKRHHTRFFPLSEREACGRGNNIMLGTVVDKTITDPKLFEFYLCSHFGIQGTSRPIRYHVLTDDNHLTADQLQYVTFYLSHCFARCTRPVSLPAPLYYADLACRRARIHLQDKIDFSSDTMSQSGEGTTATQVTEDELRKGSTVMPNIKATMYFT